MGLFVILVYGFVFQEFNSNFRGCAELLMLMVFNIVATVFHLCCCCCCCVVASQPPQQTQEKQLHRSGPAETESLEIRAELESGR